MFKNSTYLSRLKERGKQISFLLNDDELFSSHGPGSSGFWYNSGK